MFNFNPSLWPWMIRKESLVMVEERQKTPILTCLHKSNASMCVVQTGLSYLLYDEAGSSLRVAGALYGPGPTLVTAAASTTYTTPAVRLVSSRLGLLAATLTLLNTRGPARTTTCEKSYDIVSNMEWRSFSKQ